jgi:hypothetical protein
VIWDYIKFGVNMMNMKLEPLQMTFIHILDTSVKEQRMICTFGWYILWFVLLTGYPPDQEDVSALGPSVSSLRIDK